MKRFKNILFATNLDERERDSLVKAIKLAKMNKAKLTLLHVQPEMTSDISLIISKKKAIEVQALISKKIEEKLKDFSRLAKKKGVFTEVKILSGNPFVEIIKMVIKEKSDLLVLSVFKLKGVFQKRLFGSLSSHLFRKCPCDIWAIHLPVKKNKKIMAAIDPSKRPEGRELNQKIIELALSLAKSNNAELDIINVWDPAYNYYFLKGRVGMTKSELASYLNQYRVKKRDLLDQFLARFEFKDVKFKIHFLKGEPGLQIGKIAKKENIDIIVMGTIVKAGLKGVFIGSTAEEVFQNVECSVLAVKPEKFLSPFI